jgi:hypothetical protein
MVRSIDWSKRSSTRPNVSVSPGWRRDHPDRLAGIELVESSREHLDQTGKPIVAVVIFGAPKGSLTGPRRRILSRNRTERNA